MSISTRSVCPDSLRRSRLNSIEPPRYGPVCQVVWEGRRREAPPYPDQSLVSQKSKPLVLHQQELTFRAAAMSTWRAAVAVN
jgi:hypothetical protein